MARIKLRLGPISGLLCFLIAAFLIRNSGYLIFLLLLAAFAVHEIGHISFGGFMGYQAYELRVTPLGGCLLMDPLLRIDPEAELLIAAAGPMLNLIMSGGVFYLQILGISHPCLDLWQRLNLLIGVINLAPALPLDGGRMIHAFLSVRCGEKVAGVIGQRITGAIGILSLGLGVYKVMVQQGGLFFIIFAFLTFTQIWRHPDHGLDLMWRLRQRKQKRLKEKGFLPLKPLLVAETALIHTPIQQCGSCDGLLFLVAGRDQKLTLISEEQAWATMVQNGIKATFRETMK